MAEISPQTKYERLALEYSKLRSNASILKKAVLEEKESNTKLMERLKSSDMAQRKHEQELEALRFRNQQLVKRVEVLQSDLDAALSGSSKKRFPSTVKSRGAPNSTASGDLVCQPDQEVIMEQLQKTIEDNARLVVELSETKSKHDGELRRVRDELNKSLEETERSLSNAKTECDTAQANCSMLRDEKLTLENQLIAKETTLQQRMVENSELRERVEKLRTNIIVPNSEVITETDMAAPEPLEVLPTVQEALGHSLRLVRGLKEWHENDVVRLSVPLGPLRSSTELTEAMEKCSRAAGNLEQEVEATEKSLKEKKPSLNPEAVSRLRTTFAAYVQHLSDGIPVSAKRIEDECALSFCPPTLVKRNTEIVASMKEFSSVISELKEHFCDKKGTRNMPEVAGELKQAGREMARLFNCKVSLEAKAAEIPDKVKSANEAMVHGLLVARSAIDKLTPLLSNSTFSPCGFQLLREVLFSDSGISNGTPSSPGTVSSADSERLEREITTLKTALKELEQARDSLGLEAQLERMRREKEVQRRTELEKELTTLRSLSNDEMLQDDRTPVPIPSTAMPQEEGERESVIVRYYQNIVSNQQQQLYQMTSIAENLAVETENIRAQWSMSLKRSKDLEDEISQLKVNTKGITEDLDSTRKNYETQLSTLTEHIADMNDKLIERQENIVDLRRQLESKIQQPVSQKLKLSNFHLPTVSKRK